MKAPVGLLSGRAVCVSRWRGFAPTSSTECDNRIFTKGGIKEKDICSAAARKIAVQRLLFYGKIDHLDWVLRFSRVRTGPSGMKRSDWAMRVWYSRS